MFKANRWMHAILEIEEAMTFSFICRSALMLMVGLASLLHVCDAIVSWGDADAASVHMGIGLALMIRTNFLYRRLVGSND